jgi:hypothetical protein
MSSHIPVVDELCDEAGSNPATSCRSSLQFDAEVSETFNPLEVASKTDEMPSRKKEKFEKGQKRQSRDSLISRNSTDTSVLDPQTLALSLQLQESEDICVVNRADPNHTLGYHSVTLAYEERLD